MNYLDVVLRTFSSIKCILKTQNVVVVFSPLIFHSSGWAVTSIDRNKNLVPVFSQFKRCKSPSVANQNVWKRRFIERKLSNT